MLAVAALVVALASVVAVSSGPPAAAAGSCCGPTINPIACENQQTGDPASDWQVSGAGDSTHPGLRHVDERERRADRVASRSTPRRRRTTSTSCGSGYYQGNGARKVAVEHAAVGDAPADPAGLPATTPRPPGSSTAATGPCRPRGRCRRTAVSGLYLAHLVRDDTGGRQPHPVRRPQRREPLRHRGPDLGRDLAGLQHLRRQQPLHVRDQLPAREPRRRTRAPRRCPTTGRSTPRRTTAAGAGSCTPSTT